MYTIAYIPPPANPRPNFTTLNSLFTILLVYPPLPPRLPLTQVQKPNLRQSRGGPQEDFRRFLFDDLLDVLLDDRRRILVPVVVGNRAQTLLPVCAFSAVHAFAATSSNSLSDSLRNSHLDRLQDALSDERVAARCARLIWGRSPYFAVAFDVGQSEGYRDPVTSLQFAGLDRHF